MGRCIQKFPDSGDSEIYPGFCSGRPFNVIPFRIQVACSGFTPLELTFLNCIEGAKSGG